MKQNELEDIFLSFFELLQFQNETFDPETIIKTNKKKVEAKETVFNLKHKYDLSTYDYCCRPQEFCIDKYIVRGFPLDF